jgi:hypothetical protein
MTGLIERYSIGDCEMRPTPTGSWMRVNQLRALIELWLTEDDDSSTILSKLEELKNATL